MFCACDPAAAPRSLDVEVNVLAKELPSEPTAAWRSSACEQATGDCDQCGQHVTFCPCAPAAPRLQEGHFGLRPAIVEVRRASRPAPTSAAPFHNICCSVSCFLPADAAPPCAAFLLGRVRPRVRGREPALAG